MLHEHSTVILETCIRKHMWLPEYCQDFKNRNGGPNLITIYSLIGLNVYKHGFGYCEHSFSLILCFRICTMGRSYFLTQILFSNLYMVGNIFRTRLETDSVHCGRQIMYTAGDRFCRRWETDLDRS